MNRSMKRSARHLLRQRTRGQSIPIIALMVVILIAMVGLSVDVGNTFAQERKAVAAGNAASIAAMDSYIKGGTGVTNEVVYEAITASLTSNAIPLGEENDQLQLEAYYLDADGARMQADPIEGNADLAPENVSYIEVKLDGKVDTFFARITGRADLPLGAQAYAGRCPPTSGVYPIAIPGSLLDGESFADPGITDPQAPAEYGIMTSREFRNYTWRRVYLGAASSPAGAFNFLRWNESTSPTGTSATSAVALEASMSGDGNLDEGFEEVGEWPTNSLPAPDVYPVKPNQLNPGDWVYGSPGNMNSVKTILEQHMANKTYMILPIFDTAIGNGANVSYRITGLGAFVIKEIGDSLGRGTYIDLVSLGSPDGQGTACATSAVTPPEEDFDLVVPVSIWPEYQEIPQSHVPVQFMVVLDVSGSMSANFNGQCNNSGSKQCANGPAGYPAVNVTGTGPSYWWNPQDERRIYVAKNAMKRLVDLMNLPGNPSYNAAFPQDEMALIWFNGAQSTSMTTNWTSTSGTLKTAIDNAGKYGGDIYRTEGGTNGAAGLYRASLMLKNRPANTTFGGKNWKYKRVVIYISDGVSNQFLDTSKANLSGGGSDAGTYASGNACKSVANLAESATCQTTDVGGVHISKGWDRPITQMVNTSRTNIQNDPQTDAQVYVVALSNIPATGLKDGVASFPSYFYPVPSLQKFADGKTNVDLIIESIYGDASQPECIPRADGEWRNTFPAESGGGLPGLDYPVIGEATITLDDITITSPILVGSNGQAEAVFTNLPRGIYSLTTYLFYRHPLDPPTVLPRRYSLIETAGDTTSALSVPVPNGSSLGKITRQPVGLKLFGNTCAGQ